MWATKLGKATLLAWVGIATTIISSFLPWAKVWFVTVNGFDGDGKITAVLGVGAALLFGFARVHAATWRKGLVIGSLVVSVLTALTYIYELIHISTTDQAEDNLFEVEVTVGVGVYLGIAGALLAVVATAIALGERSKAPSGPTAWPPPNPPGG